MTTANVKIESRTHLLSALTEAAELEHNLMCMYLFAVFSLKQSTAENLTATECEAVQKWRKAILSVCVQEMTHLALVNNLSVAVGGAPHFYRSEFPIRSGLFPDAFVLALAPFNLDTLEHFIFLERPENAEVVDNQAFATEVEFEREAPEGRLMAHGGNYTTVGQLYAAISDGIAALSESIGEQKLFCGPPSLQFGPADVDLKGLTTINSSAQAKVAIDLIIDQGEGSRTPEGSHFETFEQIKAEYLALLNLNPNFAPARPVVRNPVMRKPTIADERIWINHPTTAPLLDIANAIYALMLQFLVQLYSMPARAASARKVLVDGAFSLMHVLGAVSSALAQLPSEAKPNSLNAAISFALNRGFSPLELANELSLLNERIDELLQAARRLEYDSDKSAVATPAISSLIKTLSQLSRSLIEIKH